MDENIGTCNAVIASIATKADGSIKLTLEVNPSEQEIISKLLSKWSLDQRLLSISLSSVES